jgi:hypothetical protein
MDVNTIPIPVVAVDGRVIYPEDTDDEFSAEWIDEKRFINGTNQKEQPEPIPYRIIGEAFMIDPTGHGDICHSDADPGL